MKKTFKKIGAILMLAVFMLGIIGPGLGAYAADDGTITIKNTVDGKVYNIYKVFDLTHSGDKVSYTIASEWEDFFKGAGAKYISDTNTGNSLNPIIVERAVKYINITDDNVAKFAQDALAFAGSKTPTKSATANGESYKFTGLSLGYYLVYPQGASLLKDGFASISSITSAKPNGEVNVKSTYPTVEKKVDKESFDYGQEATYTLTSKVPDTTGYSEYTFKMTDTLSKGLTLNPNNVTVKIGGTDKTTDENIKCVTNVTNGKLEITFDMLKLKSLKGQEIEVTYKAAINEQAIIGQDGNSNEVTLEYSNDPKDGSKTATTKDNKKVYTAALTINKLDGKDEAIKLPGAEFVLRDGTDTKAKYYRLEDGKVTWVEKESDATKVVTDGKGRADFKGLKNGTYYLEETKAPEGYNMLTDKVEAVVDYANQSADVFATFKVLNNTGSVLPGTGGMGAKLFIVIGGGIGLLAAGMYRRSRKMNAGNR
ncbi:MAG: SpaH/EbpB family LPXTG-anchored major pilin [Clostridiales bacterium]|nr:SpaH/EbpB family LPXTG-anchored major pilin [Clostridiales bacterium]